MTKNIKLLFGFCILFYFGWQIWQFFYGERILVGSGFGWDGVQYATWVSQFSFQNYFQHQLSGYYLQRILPSIAVHYLMIVFHLNIHSNILIINTFICFNNFLLLLTILGLFNLARFLRWTPEATLIAFISLCFNFVILKQMTYYSTLTDYTAFSIGFFQLYFFIKDRKLFLYVLSILGAFTWPVLLLSGFLLLLFDKSYFKNVENNPITSFVHKKAFYKTAFLLLIFSFILSTSIYGTYCFLKKISPTHPVFAEIIKVLHIQLWDVSFVHPILKLSVISIFIVLLYFFYIVGPIFGLFISAGVEAKKKLQFWLMLGCCILAYLCIHFVITHFSLTMVNEPSLLGFLVAFLFSIAAPGKFIVSYFIYFGISFLFLILIFKKINFQDIAKLGMSYFILLIIFLLQIHSRFGTPYFPLIALILGTQLSKVALSFRFCLGYMILAFLFSFAWIPLNWPDQALSPTTTDLFEWPWQVYFATSGLWTTDVSYSIELVLMSIAGFILYKMVTKEGIISP